MIVFCIVVLFISIVLVFAVTITDNIQANARITKLYQVNADMHQCYEDMRKALQKEIAVERSRSDGHCKEITESKTELCDLSTRQISDHLWMNQLEKLTAKDALNTTLRLGRLNDSFANFESLISNLLEISDTDEYGARYSKYLAMLDLRLKYLEEACDKRLPSVENRIDALETWTKIKAIATASTVKPKKPTAKELAVKATRVRKVKK